MGKPLYHGRDHLPGGADPIPGSSGGSNIQTVQLFSSQSLNGDASYDLPASGSGGAINGIPYLHSVQPADTSWYTLRYGGSPAVAPPYDGLALTGVGQYSISAWTHLVDGGSTPTFTQADAWFSHQIVALAGSFTDVVPQYYVDAKLVYGTGVGSPAMAHNGTNGGFYAVANCYVTAGHTGFAYVAIAHQDNWVVTIYPEQFLQVVYYGPDSLGAVE